MPKLPSQQFVDPKVHQPTDNQLPKVLSAEVQQGRFPHMELIEMPLGKVLCESGDVLRYVYFPTGSIAPLRCGMESGSSAEISVVGHNGMIAVALLSGRVGRLLEYTWHTGSHTQAVLRTK